MENNRNVYGLGILDILQIIFVVLKLVGVITWSWPVVLIPLWITLGLIAIILILVTLINL